ncbi:ABC transporter ATP-binding protein [Clostridium saccharoperbutylacetonicum]|jgi:ABC-2 type transport system ATP-binding protein|uniref:ATP-binding transport protein NatA n=1 Tax=Clostridium saccharoperbutylacetonicum N1-4(HMT) TaxID=931276 RepID=M1MMQ1_9CLOT|nr:ABC transporter ATP-binding protein [Clostridium saccharoperbutylacetonicum]AGF56016.1 ATP-binding transport protein NatA [Clostridium saccharoperbutylacetonicum N1-4(HMT)]AQR94751.1 daunorubicin/doxorubicin resistance ATP-binding protein DrrA [Clostridium saccharoperbutylacetonicum]NRT63245.1 ABC-2 type transport system ATP-binding protein [Clostridium saccharoperbutylacetonicum]NSB26605.1 ABC-2 type transport system ATP-binding protein [Clostridium saccharoperbutylacetonicum]NSB30592.1 AB
MIEARNLKKIYETKISKGLFKSEKVKFEAVKDVSIKLKEGQIIGLLGINGAGKTTTIKMLTTLLSPTSGEYFVDGIDAVKNPMVIKKKINMVAGGEKMIYFRLTPQENLWYYGQLYGIPNKLLQERIDYLLKLVGLYENKDKKVEEFSKGMKQRLQIARGLINDPQYIFMDEPTLGLDAVTSKELRENVKVLTKERGKGILLTSHYMEEVEELADYIYVLDKGEIIKQGTVKELSKDVFTKIEYKLILHNNIEGFDNYLFNILASKDSTVEVYNDEKTYKIISSRNLSLDISKACINKGAIIKEYYEIVPNLEDTIIKLSKKGA